jgi:hypothetical protein
MSKFPVTITQVISITLKRKFIFYPLKYLICTPYKVKNNKNQVIQTNTIIYKCNRAYEFSLS